MLKLADLAAIAALARRHGVLAAADNTFATPYLQRPLELGFDLVMHSGTKYLNGHSDVVNGVLVVGENAELWPSGSAFLQNSVGAVAGPFDAFLALRGAEDAGAAHAAALRERTRAGALPGAASEGRARALSGPAPRIRSTRWRARRCAIRAGRAPMAA